MRIPGHARKRFCDLAGRRLKLGDMVGSTASYSDTPTQGLVVDMQGELIVVRHLDGAEIGKEFRSASHLWVKST